MRGTLVALLGITALGHGLSETPLRAQDNEPQSQTIVLHPGDGRADGRIFQPFSVTWKATTYTDDGEAQAGRRIEELLAITGSPEDPLLRFTQTWYDSLGAVVFTTVRVAEQPTMAYRAFQTGATPGGLAHLDINGEELAGFYVEAPEGPTHHFSLKLGTEVFASFGGLLFAALAPEPGLVGEFPAFGWGGTTNPVARTQRFSVGGIEPVGLPNGESIQSYRIQTGQESGPALTYWVAPEPPYFVKAESRPAAGGITVFEIDEWALPPSRQ